MGGSAHADRHPFTHGQFGDDTADGCGDSDAGLRAAGAFHQRHLLFVRGAENRAGSLWRVPVTGGPAAGVGISVNARITSPAVNPDGKRIAFAAREADNNEVWALENFLPAQAATR